MKNKKAQLAVFVIIALIIAAIILLYFFLSRSSISIVQDDVSPQNAIEKCIHDSVESATEKILPQGGFIEPENYKTYKNINVEYLCQNIGYFKPCINQHPLLINEEIRQIKDYISPISERCFSNAKTELEKRNYIVSMSEQNITVFLASNRIFVDVERKMSITKNEQSQTFNEFNIELINPLYDLSKIAIEIANQEAKYCYFEYVGYMILYPRFDIRKFAFSDSTKIYTIKDKQSKKEMNIAIRSCAIPGGI